MPLPGFMPLMMFDNSPPELKDLGGTSTANGGVTWTWNIPGRASGSSISGSNTDGNAVSDQGTHISSVFNNFGGNHTATVTITETLAGSPNSPRTSTITVTVTAAA